MTTLGYCLKMEKAVCLVDFEGDALKLMDNGLQHIESIPEGYSIITKAVVGPGRIGKSSLLNWLVRKNVFEIGSKTTRVTKGIWIYIDVKHDSKLAHMYIDVEGFGDPTKANVTETDSQLLIIVIQICDVIMYNIKGVYDQDICEKINFVCRLFNKYRKQNQVLSKPILVSVLRDFHLDPPESPDKEFAKLFEESKAVFETFREIKAFPLAKPVEGKITDLKNTPDTKLCPEFVEVRNRIEEYLRAKAEPLRASSQKNITGMVLAESLRKTVKAVNDDDLKFLSKTLPEIFKEQNVTKMKSVLATYEQDMKKHWPGMSDSETLSKMHSEHKDAAIKEVKEKCFFIDGSVELDQGSFEENIEKIFKHLSMSTCNDALSEVCMFINRRIKDEWYYKVGGYDKFHHDLSEVERDYKRRNNLGSEKERVWSEYTEKMTETKKLIQENAKVKELEQDAGESKKEVDSVKQQLQFEKDRLASKEKELKEKEESTLSKVADISLKVLQVAAVATDIYSKVKEGKSFGTKSASKPTSKSKDTKSTSKPTSKSKDTPL